MRQRIAALGGVGVAALLGFVLLWGGLVTRPVSAMEKMAETIRRAKSLKATVVEDVPNSNPSMPRVFAVMGTLYWLAPDSTCLDLKGILIPGKSSGERHDVTWIYLVGKRAICIDHKAKTFKWVSNYHRHTNLEEMLAKLAEFPARPIATLASGTSTASKTHGFEIGRNKLFRVPEAKGTVEVWIDVKSNLPVLVEESWEMMAHECAAIRTQDFQWNIDLDPKLFAAVPPQGYTDMTFVMPTVEERLRWFTRTLRFYVELTDGSRYPPAATMLEADASAKELYKSFGFEMPKGRPTPEQARDAKFQKLEKVWGGLDGIASLVQFLNPDAAYYGKTVTPKDKDKVLLRWKLDDGRYEVIYGDLATKP